MISYDEILKGRDSEYPLTEKLERNLEKLYTAINKVRQAYGKPMTVNSGYRPGRFNKKLYKRPDGTWVDGAPRSAHLTCEAVDIADPNKAFAKWCLLNLHVLEEAGLWMESPAATPSWVHLQIRPVAGKRVFNP